MIDYIKKQRGFTLIETLVAISILMIAIAGPLTVANKGYTASIETKARAVAMNLAQEGLEYLNNRKDNKTLAPTWKPYTGINFASAESSLASCSLLGPCSFSSIQGTDGGIMETQGIKSYQYYFSNVTGTGNPEQITAYVKVVWSNGLIENELVLDQIFTNYER